ncbi:MAG TPA: TauD/TfdA family dioxygenase [Hyphomicrobiales bacterium]|nr:TauD/TfdA family dioxygenase [Hyphomicrobiales bacterium]
MGSPERASSAVVAHRSRPAPIVKPITPALGAEIAGVDLGGPLDDDAIAELSRLLHAHKVLVFRDQDLSAAQHVALSRRFGELEIVPMGPQHPDHPELLLFDSGPERKATENLWHTDSTFWRRPPIACILRCIELPNVGGDTIWANMAAAYEGLADDVKARIEGLHAMHDMMPNFGHRFPVAEHNRLRQENPATAHPVVLTHPDTGEKILYVNTGFTTHIVDYRRKYPTTEGAQYKTFAAELLLFLLRQAQIPEYQMRLRWERNTVVFWDNLATQHYALSDYYPKTRRMARTTILGKPLQ